MIYMNWGETILFKKQNTLWNLFHPEWDSDNDGVVTYPWPGKQSGAGWKLNWDPPPASYEGWPLHLKKISLPNGPKGDLLKSTMWPQPLKGCRSSGCQCMWTKRPGWIPTTPPLSSPFKVRGLLNGLNDLANPPVFGKPTGITQRLPGRIRMLCYGYRRFKYLRNLQNIYDL